MQRMNGLLHETSTAQQGLQTYSVGSIAGQKRPPPLDDAGFARPEVPARDNDFVQFQRALHLPNSQPRIKSSKIADFRGAQGISEYSQRRAFPATPSSTNDPELDLRHPLYDLPFQFIDNFALLGIKSIYPWQRSCLKGPGLLNGCKNLIYSAPTGGGKSLVADCKALCMPFSCSSTDIL